MPASVRIATAEDAEDVARLLIAFRNWTGRSEPGDESFRASVRQLLGDPGTDYLLAGDPPAGVAQLRYRYGIWYAAHDCWLEDLYVSDTARGSGLGRALVEAAFERARVRGCRRIELDVDEANYPAVALYESLGFASGTGPGERNLFMRRRF